MATASRMTVAPPPVFQSLQAGHMTPGFGLQGLVLDHRIGIEGGEPGTVTLGLGVNSSLTYSMDWGWTFLSAMSWPRMPETPCSAKAASLAFSVGSRLSQGRGEPKGGSGLAGGPHLGQSRNNRVLLLLESEFEFRRARGAGDPRPGNAHAGSG